MKNYLYETAVLLCLALLPGSGASAQERSALRTAGPRFAVRTNALYWATASLNAGFEDIKILHMDLYLASDNAKV